MAPAVAQECDCPACSGADLDPAELVHQLLDGIADGLAALKDVLDVELAGAGLLDMVAAAGEAELPAVVEAFVPRIEAEASADALAVLLALSSVAGGVAEQVTDAAAAAAQRMMTAGVPAPPWAAALAEPVSMGAGVRLSDSSETLSILAAPFWRGAQGYAFLVVVDGSRCGEAAEIVLTDADQLAEALAEIRSGEAGLDVGRETEALDPAEWRWYVEEALAARAVHDEEDPDSTLMYDEDDEDGGPPFPVLAVLLRARLATLPAARRPAGMRHSLVGHSEVAGATGGFGIAARRS